MLGPLLRVNDMQFRTYTTCREPLWAQVQVGAVFTKTNTPRAKN